MSTVNNFDELRRKDGPKKFAAEIEVIYSTAHVGT